MAKSKTKTYTTSDLAREFSISVVSASRFNPKNIILSLLKLEITTLNTTVTAFIRK